MLVFRYGYVLKICPEGRADMVLHRDSSDAFTMTVDQIFAADRPNSCDFYWLPDSLGSAVLPPVSMRPTIKGELDMTSPLTTADSPASQAAQKKTQEIPAEHIETERAESSQPPALHSRQPAFYALRHRLFT